MAHRLSFSVTCTQTPLQFFTGMGYTVVGTGGGCEALATQSYFVEGKPYMMITAADEPAVPTSWDNITVGAYDGTNDTMPVWFASTGEPA